MERNGVKEVICGETGQDNQLDGIGSLLRNLPWKPTVLTLNLLTTTIVAPPSNASKWQMGFNSAFKG
jgi:hypothetical protein